MAKYRPKNTVVDARPYARGMEDGWVNPASTDSRRHVYKSQIYGHWVPVVFTEFGPCNVSTDDFIVRGPGGRVRVMPRKMFEQQYEFVSPDEEEPVSNGHHTGDGSDDGPVIAQSGEVAVRRTGLDDGPPLPARKVGGA